MAESKCDIWTASLDYAATGEGRTMVAPISCASDAEGARRQFAEEFSLYFAQVCTVEPGVARNEVTRFLWSEQALAYFEQIDHRGGLEASSMFHFNLS